jgi:predicted nuclease of predicted toxin-antitoxin system
MNFKIDENLPVEVAELLKQAGHDAANLSEKNLIGTSDINLAALCQKEKRTIITLDTDFADIRTYSPKRFCGIIVMRLNRQDKYHVLEVFRHVMQLFPTEPIDQHLWFVEEGRIRIRS